VTQRLFMRSWRVQVGPFATTDLDCSFKIERTTAARPGTCELTLYNLSAEHRAQILALPRRRSFGSAAGAANPQTVVEVSAGYVEAERPVIFRGNLRRAVQKREHPEWTLELGAGDGEFALRRARGGQAARHRVDFGQGRQIIVEQLGQNGLRRPVGHRARKAQAQMAFGV